MLTVEQTFFDAAAAPSSRPSSEPYRSFPIKAAIQATESRTTKIAFPDAGFGFS
jgi:hypothetical protein